MEIKKYSIFIVITLAVAAGVLAFYFFKPGNAVMPVGFKLNQGALKNLSSPDLKTANKTFTVQPKKISFTQTQLLDAQAKVNQELAGAIKIIRSSLTSGEEAFSVMADIYGNKDYSAFFSPDNSALKTEAEKSRAGAEDSFLYARSALMLALSDARENTGASVDKTLAFLNDLAAALSGTKKALNASVLIASIDQPQMDGFKNKVDGVFGEIAAVRSSLLAQKQILDKVIKDPAYQEYLKRFKETNINE